MARVAVRTMAQARSVGALAGVAGGETLAFFDRPDEPIHLHHHRLHAGETLHVRPHAIDRMLYVWRGRVTAGSRILAAGSSLMVGRGAAIDLAGRGEAELLAFQAAAPADTSEGNGAVHLLPSETVPRFSDLEGGSGTAGGMHADGGHPGCGLWLHENSFAPRAAPAAPADRERGIHAHSEDEVIFVTSGEMRLGARSYGPGTALAIAADTFYGFSGGVGGLGFINFRPARPGAIRFKQGGEMDEVGYWRDRLPRPRYLAPLDR